MASGAIGPVLAVGLLLAGCFDRRHDERLIVESERAQGREHEVGPPPELRPADRVWTDIWVRRGGRWRSEAAQDLDPARR